MSHTVKFYNSHSMSLPYSDMDFSKRLLKLHLDQKTNQSSRTFKNMHQQIKWIHSQVPSHFFNNILHPLCGPGLFASLLKKLPINKYWGIDISPAAINYATKKLYKFKNFKFTSSDFTTMATDQEKFDLCLLTYEAINAFPKDKLECLLKKCSEMLNKNGVLFAEIRGTLDYETNSLNIIESCPNGSFLSDLPHILKISKIINNEPPYIYHQFDCYNTKLCTEAFYSAKSTVWYYSYDELKTILLSSQLEIFKTFPACGIGLEQNECKSNYFILARKL